MEQSLPSKAFFRLSTAARETLSFPLDGSAWLLGYVDDSGGIPEFEPQLVVRVVEDAVHMASPSREVPACVQKDVDRVRDAIAKLLGPPSDQWAEALFRRIGFTDLGPIPDETH